MMKRMIGLMMACTLAAVFMAANASAQIWTENFDSYAPGSGIFGQGGWSAWGDDPTYDSFVTDFISNSPANSLDVMGDSDSIYRFNINHGTIDCGEWTLTCMQYVPGDLVAANDTYFILLNEYDGTNNNWSTQVTWDPDTDTVIDTGDGNTLPIIYDQWVEIRVVIDLDNDTQEFYYGGDLLYAGTWTEHISGGGQLELQTLDLFANGASSVYYDDFALEQTRLCPGVVWQDAFDTYAPGSGIFGQGGWSAWGDDPTYDSFVTDFISNSPANSLDVMGDSDSIYRFNINHGTIDCGEYTLTCMQYVPGDLVAPNDTYFILLNEYDGTNNNWSTQVTWDPDTDTVIDTGDGNTLPIIYDQWVEIRVVIDLDNDTQEFYYGGDLLYAGTWTEHISGGGQLELQTLDLFAYGASSVYYDDFQLKQTRDCVTSCLDLTVENLVGGEDATFTVAGGEPGRRGVVAWGLGGEPSKFVDLKDWCATFGFNIKLKGPKIAIVGSGIFNDDGIFMLNRSVRSELSGREIMLQAAEQGTCPDECMSNIVQEVVQ